MLHVVEVAPAMRYVLTYSARIVTLILTTLLGCFFVIWCAIFIPIFLDMPGIISREDVIGGASVGLGFALLAALYIFLVRKTSRGGANKQRMLV